MGRNKEARNWKGREYLDVLLMQIINEYLGKGFVSKDLLSPFTNGLIGSVDDINQKIKLPSPKEATQERIWEAAALFLYSLNENVPGYKIYVGSGFYNIESEAYPDTPFGIIEGIQTDDANMSVFNIYLDGMTLITHANGGYKARGVTSANQRAKELNDQILSNSKSYIQVFDPLKGEYQKINLSKNEEGTDVYACFFSDSFLLQDETDEKHLQDLSDDPDSAILLLSSGGDMDELAYLSLEDLYEKGIIDYPDILSLDKAFDYFGIKPNYQVWDKLFKDA